MIPADPSAPQLPSNLDSRAGEEACPPPSIDADEEPPAYKPRLPGSGNMPLLPPPPAGSTARVQARIDEANRAKAAAQGTKIKGQALREGEGEGLSNEVETETECEDCK